MDLAQYKSLLQQEVDLNRANPVTVEVTWDEFDLMRHGIMLLRRIASNTGDQDLNIVDDAMTTISTKILMAFRAVPGADEIRAAQMEMLKPSFRNPEGHPTKGGERHA